MEEQPWYTSWYVKTTVIVVVVIFIYIKVKPYIYHLLDTIETIRSLINMVLSFSENVTKTAVDETAIGSKLIVNKLSKPIPEPSESKPGYCFVGEWKGIRSCVKVDNTPCSTQIYSTKQQCVNPTLR
jgi:hypothetical protein